MHRIKTFSVIAALLFCIHPLKVVMSQVLSVKIDPQETAVSSGESFTLNVAISQATNVGSFQFDVTFLTSVVHADSAWLGNFLGSTGRSVSPVGPVINNTATTGKVTMGGFSFGAGNGPNGSGVLATIKFTALDTGVTAIDLQQLQITDINGQVQNVASIVDGIVRVAPQIHPVDPEKTLVEVNPANIPADGISTTIITVKPRDSLGNSLGTGQTVSLTSTAGELLATVSDNGEGSYTQVLRSSTVPGSAVITAIVNGVTVNQKPHVVFTALSGAAIKINPTDTTVTPGDTFIMDIVIQDAQNLGSFQFDIEFSTAVVHADSAWLGSFLGSTGRSASPVGPVINNDSPTGKVTMGGFSFGTTNGPNGVGVLATIKFTARDTGTTVIDLQQFQVTDIDGQAQGVGSIVDGRVRVAFPSSLLDILIDAEKDAWYDELTGPEDGYLQIRWFAHNN
ncbi:hypothetical protein JW998_10670, partial [candidate division KSB1 bacterium]|nr:hypothetical protein [candidate division KSB1 bacterium]